jgi:N-acylneuraminate cytidylyltransferase
MIQNKKILAVIPARGGSKGIPRKNIRPLAGKPLIAWTIAEAKHSRYIDRLIVSSEDDEIIRVAEEWGCEAPFKRPTELAQDDTPGIGPILHALKNFHEQYDYVLMLQPTSPLRTVADIDGCIRRCIETNAVACVSVTDAQTSPYWMFTVSGEGTLKPLFSDFKRYPRRQDLPKVYELNGAVYIAERQWLIRTESFLGDETLAYVMDPTHSVDIDAEADFQRCEVSLRQRAGSS